MTQKTPDRSDLVMESCLKGQYEGDYAKAVIDALPYQNRLSLLTFNKNLNNVDDLMEEEDDKLDQSSVMFYVIDRHFILDENA